MKRFGYAITVGAADIDLLGHVNNIEYVRWIQDVAIRHSESVGLGWDVYRELNAAFVIRRHEIDYVRPSRLGDVLRIETWIEKYTRITAVRATRIADAKGNDLVTALTTWVFVTLDSGRPCRMSEVVRRAFLDDGSVVGHDA